jgi:2-methylisocitrate lyase-like PEP mutase family enzyme
MTSQAQKLRDLIDAGDPFFAADCYSALTARVVQYTGFKAAYLGGHACGAFHYAVPDNGILSQVEQLDQAQRIAAAIDIPLIVDADSLGETVADAFHYTRRYEQAGIAGFHVEDERNPKHGSYANGLIDIVEMQAKIEAIVKARTDLVVIVRCDELYPLATGGGGGGSVQEAIKRGKAYLEAGADSLVYPTAPAEQIAELVAALPKGRISCMGSAQPGAICTMSTGWGWTGAVETHFERCRTLMETGAIKGSMTFEAKNQLIDQDLYDGIIADWANKTGRPTR